MFARHTRLATSIALALMVSAGVTADEFTIDRHTIDGGGVTFSTGGAFELAGTIGQPDAGTMSSGDLTLSGGFWFSAATGDCNTDGAVNLIDFNEFTLCLSGPQGGLGELDCACFDLDNDNDVDLSDLAEVQQSFTN